MAVTKTNFFLGVITVLLGVVVAIFVPLKVDEEGIVFIKKHEAFASCPYLDQGLVPTIGYGMTKYPQGDRVSLEDDCITIYEADYYLRHLLREYEYSVHSSVESSLTQSQYNALTSFCYNIGVKAFQRSGMLKRVNENPNDPFIIKEFYKWVYVKGRISKGLVKRREAEIDLYFK